MKRRYTYVEFSCGMWCRRIGKLVYSNFDEVLTPVIREWRGKKQKELAARRKDLQALPSKVLTRGIGHASSLVVGGTEKRPKEVGSGPRRRSLDLLERKPSTDSLQSDVSHSVEHLLPSPSDLIDAHIPQPTSRRGPLSEAGQSMVLGKAQISRRQIKEQGSVQQGLRAGHSLATVSLSSVSNVTQSLVNLVRTPSVVTATGSTTWMSQDFDKHDTDLCRRLFELGSPWKSDTWVLQQSLRQLEAKVAGELEAQKRRLMEEARDEAFKLNSLWRRRSLRLLLRRLGRKAKPKRPVRVSWVI